MKTRTLQPEVIKECSRCGMKSRHNERSCPYCGFEAETEKTLVLQDENLRGGFAQIPNLVLRDHQLSSNAKVLYCLLLSYAWGSDECFPGREKLSEDMGCSIRTVSLTLVEVRKRKLISWQRRGLGKVNIYHIRKLSDGFLPKPIVDKGHSF